LAGLASQNRRISKDTARSTAAGVDHKLHDRPDDGPAERKPCEGPAEVHVFERARHLSFATSCDEHPVITRTVVHRVLSARLHELT
jgi:hypothetical protein